MRKATLSFTLPEDQEEHMAAVRGMSYKIALSEMDEYLRGLIKYTELTDEVHTALQEARDKLNSLIKDAEV